MLAAARYNMAMSFLPGLLCWSSDGMHRRRSAKWSSSRSEPLVRTKAQYYCFFPTAGQVSAVGKDTNESGVHKRT